MHYLNSQARGGVVYDQYTTDKECLDAALSRGILAIYHTPEVPYCYYKLVTNVIRAV